MLLFIISVFTILAILKPNNQPVIQQPTIIERPIIQPPSIYINPRPYFPQPQPCYPQRPHPGNGTTIIVPIYRYNK